MEKKKRPWQFRRGNANKYGKKSKLDSMRRTSNGSIVVSIEATPKTSQRLRGRR